MRDKDTVYQRHRSFVYFLWVILFGAIYFSCYNLIRDLYNIALVESTGIVLSGLALFSLKHISERTIEMIKRAYVLFFLFTMSYSVWFLPFENITVFSWLFVIPLLSYFMIGSQWGFWSSLALFLMNLIFQTFVDDDNKLALNLGAFSDVIMAYAVVWLLTHGYQRKNENAKKRLQEQAYLDNLTGLYNRTLLAPKFESAVDSAKTNDTIAMALIDVDWFKSINDSVGHEAGDTVLKHIAQLIKDSLRKGDDVFRIGGEEFCLLIPQTSLNDAKRLCERIRLTIEQHPIDIDGHTLNMTISVGLAEQNAKQADLTCLLKQADILMYQAKDQGRNRVVCQ